MIKKFYKIHFDAFKFSTSFQKYCKYILRNFNLENFKFYPLLFSKPLKTPYSLKNPKQQQTLF
ncbi:hypothetical protein C3I04_02090 [Campylobacter jejuni]|nr:hypothetical protein C3I04_02090 [Campylobacter jejuni]